MDRERLLCVVAHPDDECFAFGGALILAAQRGLETRVICLTDGQAASNRGDAAGNEDLGRMRRQEFARSCSRMGVSSHELLDYSDGLLEYADTNAVTRKLVERMRLFRPQTVLTFGPDGGLNAHPDHAMVSMFTSLAFHWSGRPKRFPDLELVPHVPQRLYYVSTNFTMPDREVLLPAPWSVELDISSVKQTKQDAFLEHTSQKPVFEKFKAFWDTYGDHEHYTLAAAADPQQVQSVKGIF